MTSLPEGAADYVVALWVLVPVFMAAIAAWTNQRVRTDQKKHGEDLKEVKEQVTNSHNSNLRDDLDEIAKEVRGVRQDIAELRAEVRDLRGQVRDIRQESTDFEHDVREVLRRTHPDEVL
ncbi:DUF2746 domain-containing protein [Nocardia arthritidis]|uniref:DUF2746 domain-containing protein n=1 Tax=Nocardia arthritidis TaxID=228602 RepID=A0A6G9YTR0_9NOCA|nr:DUF2746 domain-containing protein [Nocardia arthritidis]QIS16507.1 DUF2746 domain-containing protein [Nocardia arthritidis]